MMGGILSYRKEVIYNSNTPVKPGRVTIAGNPGDDIAPGTLNSVLKQAGLKRSKSK